MPFDISAAEQVAAEATRAFHAGLQKLVTAAAKEAELEWQRLQNESHALAEDRRRLEEAWKLLHETERIRLKDETLGARGAAKAIMSGSPVAAKEQLSTSRGEWAPLPSPSQKSVAPSGTLGSVPANCTVSYGQSTFSVLPHQLPDASNLGHDRWNEAVEIPEGWEVLSSASYGFDEAMAFLTQNCWGAMVLGVRNANQGFDAYWTPLFGDGSHAGQMCEADVDWIEPVDGDDRQFRMTYSGLRLVIRQRQLASPIATVLHPRIQSSMSLQGVAPWHVASAGAPGTHVLAAPVQTWPVQMPVQAVISRPTIRLG